MEYSILVRPEYFEDHEKSLDKDLRSASNVKLPADIKLALRRQQNYRRRILKEKGSEINIKQRQNKSKVSTSTQVETNPISLTFPKSLQAKAQSFLSFLQNIPGLKVNEKGEISYGAQHVSGSRKIDLVHDFVRDRPSKSPAKGWQVLAEALKEHNVPKEFIGNRSRWQYIQGLEANADPEATPRRSISRTLSDLESLRRRLQFQTGTGIKQL